VPATSRCVFLAIAGLLASPRPAWRRKCEQGTQAMRRHRGVAGQAPYAPSLQICGFTSVRMSKRQPPCSGG
jgi:hypothetical protein